jgi:polysaccharide biosynthesis transport protein
VLPQDAGFPEPAKNTPAKTNPKGKRVAGRLDASSRSARPEAQPGVLPTALASSPDMSSYIQALRRRWITAAAVGGTLALLAGLTAWFLLSPKYIAFGRIRVAYEKPRFGDTPGGYAGDFMTYLKTQAEHLMSRPVVSAALKKDELKRLNLEAMSGKDPAQYIEEELKVEFKDNQELVTVLMKSADPQVSLAVVKAIIDSYMEEIVDAQRRERIDRVAVMNKALDGASAALKQKQDALKKIVEKSTDMDPSLMALRIDELRASIREANSRRGDLRLRLKQAEADLATHKARMQAMKDTPIPPSVVDAHLKADPLAQKLKAEMEHHKELIDDFEYKQPGVTSLSLLASKRSMAKAQAGIRKRKKELQAELASAMDAMGKGGQDEMELVSVTKTNEIKALADRFDELGKDLIDFTAELQKMRQSDHVQQDRLRESIKNEEAFVNKLNLNVRQEEVELQAGSRVSKAQDAELQKKDMKHQLLGTIVSPVVVLLAVCMGVAWLDVRQRRIRSAGEVSRGLGIRVVGAVPSLPNLEKHLVGPSGEPDLEGHPALESIDALRTMLLRDADDEATRVVMVTSATHGEGKTTVASHLASSLARAGRKTLLIDGDLRRPSAHQLFELPMHPGFSEALLSEVELTDAVQATTLDGLSFMAAGQWDREVLQALARDGLEGIFEKLQEEFDFIVVDSHPVLPATDSLLIGQRVDAVILSVLREVSQMPRVYAASQRLTSLGIRVLGAVVNGADPEEALAANASARMVAA